jgi:hypothetical protein
MTYLTALLVVAVLYLWHRIDRLERLARGIHREVGVLFFWRRIARLESRLAVTDHAHSPGTTRSVVDVLLSTDTEDMVKFVDDPKSPPEERAELAVALLESLRDGSVALKPEARGRLAGAIGELLLTDTITPTTRAALAGSVDVTVGPN